MDVSVTANSRLPAAYACIPLISMPMTSYWSQFTYTPANVTIPTQPVILDKNGTVVPPNWTQIIQSLTPDITLAIIYSNTSFTSGSIISSSCSVPATLSQAQINPNLRLNSRLSNTVPYINGSTISFSWTSSLVCSDHPAAMFWQLQAWGVALPSQGTGVFNVTGQGNQRLTQAIDGVVKFEYGSASICPASTFKAGSAVGVGSWVVALVACVVALMIL
ncbi:UNVERIFIED_CONTAM: hypothetical protein HDU68_012730 [Siphonaria sp. JEL0065]|nr:hypothetical protein HDU68_012730 [Siphonaria sp. JEL0065]